MSDFKEIYSLLNGAFSETEAKGDTASYLKLSTIVTGFEVKLRDHIQNMNKEGIARIIQKLENKEATTEEEMEFIKLWIIGDAEYYINLETNFPAWLTELKKIINDINTIKDPQPSLKTGSNLRALLRAGTRLITAISFFLEQKERINHFNEAAKELDSKERAVMIKLLSGKLFSKTI